MLAEADPYDADAQRRIEEAIRREQVQRNLEMAMEHSPEAFGRVTMLYVDVEVNGRPIKAFVDSGAQRTIMSPSCAQHCSIVRLMDDRFAGTAVGVGTAKILGRVHAAPIRVGKSFLGCSFDVVEGDDVDLILGLDMLKRHQAIIDLAEGCLRIHGEKVPFLAEHELPEKARREPPGDRSKAVENGGAQAPAAAQGPEADKSPQERAIETLVALGAGREEAVRALEASGGNVELAASFIL